MTTSPSSRYGGQHEILTLSSCSLAGGRADSADLNQISRSVFTLSSSCTLPPLGFPDAQDDGCTSTPSSPHSTLLQGILALPTAEPPLRTAVNRAPSSM